MTKFINYAGHSVPEIKGAGGGKGGGNIAPNSEFSTDLLYMVSAIGEGPVYRINPNGPQDIQISDSAIDDLINMAGDGLENTQRFLTISTTGTTTQGSLPFFGEEIVSPQVFASPVSLKKGNVEGVPAAKVTMQETSANDWDALRFNFIISELYKADKKGNVNPYSVSYLITVYSSPEQVEIARQAITLTEKTDTPFKISTKIDIPVASRSANGYRFTVEKTSDDSDDAKLKDDVKIISWDEIKYTQLAYPRTALIGYAIKAVDEHTGGVPTFTSMVKGLLVKVPSNYNQPILSGLSEEGTSGRGGEIDWRQLEVGDTARSTYGYRLQKSGAGSSPLTDINPAIYIGTWDGTFVYSWTQNPAWIVYDLLTNTTYGLGIPEENIDKYKFYQVAMYCDACDPVTGKFYGVDAISDGSYRYKPRSLYTKIKENQIGLPKGTPVKERRFITDIVISDQEKTMDVLNRICGSFRSLLVYAGGKISLAVDMPDELPVMLFNETNIKQGSFQISGIKESDIYTGIDVSYIDPTNHFKRETVRIDTADSNDGNAVTEIENIASIDAAGVTRRSQAVRLAQYQIAASKYQRRNVAFTASMDAIHLAPGDLIAVASQGTGIAYGYGGRVRLDSGKNILRSSNQLTSTDWSKINAGGAAVTVAVSPYPSPTGKTAYQVFGLDTTNDRLDQDSGIPAVEGDTYTYSVWLRGSGSVNITVNTTTGIGGSGEITVNLTDTWTRHSISVTYAAGVTGNVRVRGVITRSTGTAPVVHISDPQLEEGLIVTESLANTDIALEHFTVPSITASTFTSNTYPLALRVMNLDSDRLEVYIVSNTEYAISASDNVSSGVDQVTVKVLQKLNTKTSTLTDMSGGFTANLVPKAGDLWSLGEIQNPNNYYSNKSGKLFKVTGVTRESEEAEVTVSGLEYISNVYTDSDTFINYEPTAYVDITSPFSPPPTPILSFTAKPVRRLDGSVAVDGFLQDKTYQLGYGQKFSTEYFYSTSVASTLVSNVTNQDPITFIAANADVLADGNYGTILSGKSGFDAAVGEIRLLCNSAVTSGTDDLELTVEGLQYCVDDNFNMHVLSVNDGSIPTLKGLDYIDLPVKEKTGAESSLNFIGYESDIVRITRPIDSFNASTNKIVIKNNLGGSSRLSTKLPPTPFYVSINQILAKNYYANNSLYLTGSEFTHTQHGTLLANQVNTISLQVKPRHSSFVRFYVDGILITSNLYTVNTVNSTLQYASTTSSIYRVEIDYYTVPAVELGDTIELSYGNTFVVTNSSYDVSSAKYNAALTASYVYKIELNDTPDIDLSGVELVNLTPNPVGTLVNTSGNTSTLVFNTTDYSSTFNLGNNHIYTIETGGSFQKLFSEDLVLPNLPVGTTIVKARNRNVLGRLSPFVQKSVTVQNIPIQRVENLTLTESMYKEQTGGVAVRVTCSFDHILGQEVTDYEISYKLTNIAAFGIDDSGSELDSYNTVKVPASGVDTDNKIRFTINNINRGDLPEDVSITVKVTPLNRSIRGISAISSLAIKGKLTPPKNIINFIGGQQNDIVTFFWNYERIGEQLYDLDLKEVIIRRHTGIVEATLENFQVATPIVTVSAGSGRKSVPIDSYGTFTYLAMTKDTSGNLSETVVGTTVTTTRAQRSTTVAAYSEDNPSESFAGIPNTNANEYYFPSVANSNTSGIAYAYTSSVDNANASANGWGIALSGTTDLLAGAEATYTTQIRDFGQTVIGLINVDISGDQQIQATYNDQHEEVYELVSDYVPGITANVLYDASGPGIGGILGYANANVTSGRYDANNATWMTGPANGNVWAIWNHGQYIGDTANSNSYALIAGLINSNAIALGASFYANGQPTGSNSLANVTTVSSAYALVNLRQFSDINSTYVGELGAVSSQTLIRTAISNVYYANGNVNTSAFSSTSDGFVPYEVGLKTFRYFQIKYIINNSKPDEFDFTLDKFRYSIDKEQTIFSNTSTYSSNPTTVDFSNSNFITRPVINFTVLDQVDAVANPVIVVTTAASNQSVSYQLVYGNGTGLYQANSTANVMITAIGV